MTGSEAVGYMLVEAGKIIEVRNVANNRKYTYARVEAEGVSVPPYDLKLGDWEIGFKCLDCCGTGESVDCDRYGYLVDCECPKCDGGTVWQKEY